MKTIEENGVLTAIAEDNAYLTQVTVNDGEERQFWHTIGIVGTLTIESIREASEDEKTMYERLKSTEDGQANN